MKFAAPAMPLEPAVAPNAAAAAPAAAASAPSAAVAVAEAAVSAVDAAVAVVEAAVAAHRQKLNARQRLQPAYAAALDAVAQEIRLMSALASLISSRLTALPSLPPGLALEWPGGRMGVQPAQVRLRLPKPWKPVLGYAEARQDDTDLIRLWEIAGTAHAAVTPVRTSDRRPTWLWASDVR